MTAPGEVLVTAAEAALLLGVRRSVIRVWRQRGHLSPATEGPGPLRYRLGDVWAAELATARRDTHRRRLSGVGA